jgi:AAA+ ATPase superfamily predicted ATPase
MARRLSDILNSTRQQFFVGREKELQLFKSILEQPELHTYLLSIYGPGGQGKSTLIKAFT